MRRKTAAELPARKRCALLHELIDEFDNACRRDARLAGTDRQAEAEIAYGQTKTALEVALGLGRGWRFER